MLIYAVADIHGKRKKLIGIQKNIEKYQPDALVVALGLDTFAGDPTTHFGITSTDFQLMGEMIATAGVPTLTVLEGGYSVDHIGQNTVNFLSGIDEG